MTRAVRPLVAGTLALLLLVAAPARADSVGSIKEFGWWTKRPGAQPTPNGFEVANGPDGAESVAAFRVELTGSVSQATLKFSEATDPNVAAVSGTPALKLCSTTSPWTADQQGAFDKAPTADCTVSAKMTADKTTWSGDVTPLLAGKTGEVSLMVVPDVQPAAGLVQPTFNRQFGAPVLNADGSADASAVTGGLSSSYTVPPAARQEVPAGPVFSTPSPVPVPAPASTSGAASAAASSPPSRPATQPGVVTPRGVTIGAAHGAGKAWGRLVLYIPLAVIIGLGWVLARKSLAARDLAST